MPKRLFCLIVLSLLGFSALAQDSTPRPHESATDAITHTVEQFVDAWNRHDAHAFAMTFTEDADFTNVQGVHANGRANVESFHSSRFAGIFKNTHLTASIRSIRMLSPEIAEVDADWQMTGVKAPDGSARPDRKGLLDWIMIKGPGGKWPIEIMHNTDLTNIPTTSSPK
jgi:uncharacterized protein (TIGR02246 family)